MLPFCNLVKRDSHFIWSKSLKDAFEHSKKVIVNLVFKRQLYILKVTCLTPDWCKEGIGFLLLQKSCSYTIDKAPVCCHLISGSRFCMDAECRYALIKAKAVAIAWALEKCCMFVMGCPNHEPLKGLFRDRDLSKIQNPRLFRLKEKTLSYRFTIQHCPGKWHRASDAVFHNPATILLHTYYYVKVVCVSNWGVDFYFRVYL